MSEQDRDERDERDEQEESTRSAAEWVSFSLSLVIVGAIASLIIYSWITKEDRPPVLSAIADSEVRQVEDNFYVAFSVVNTGGKAVESVEVVAELILDGEVEETGSQQINFLSGGEIQSGAFIFSQDPKAGKLVVRVASYKLP